MKNEIEKAILETDIPEPDVEPGITKKRIRDKLHFRNKDNPAAEPPKADSSIEKPDFYVNVSPSSDVTKALEKMVLSQLSEEMKVMSKAKKTLANVTAYVSANMAKMNVHKTRIGNLDDQLTAAAREGNDAEISKVRAGIKRETEKMSGITDILRRLKEPDDVVSEAEQSLKIAISAASRRFTQLIFPLYEKEVIKILEMAAAPAREALAWELAIDEFLTAHNLENCRYSKIRVRGEYEKEIPEKIRGKLIDVMTSYQ